MSGRNTDGTFSEGNSFGFEKGKSGNPNGRPLEPVSKILRELGETNQLTVNLEYTDSKGNEKSKKFDLSNKGGTLNHAIAGILLQKAITGDIKAIKELLDRQEGKSKQFIEHAQAEPQRSPEEIESEIARIEAEEAKLASRKEKIAGEKDAD